MKLDEIKEIMALLEESKLNKLRLKRGDFELLLEKEQPYERIPHHPPPPPPPHHPPPPPHHHYHHAELSTEKIQRQEKEEDQLFVTSPMVGTFYSSPAPNEPHFVKTGDRITEDTVVCIIEAMKVMNEVKAGVNGIVKEILCKNAQPVEFGTKLFRIEPFRMEP